MSVENILLLLYCALVAAAALEDMLRMRISNIWSVAVFLVSGVWAFTSSGPVLEHIVSFIGVFLPSLFMFARGWIGGGDAKLMSAAALWFPYHQLPIYISSIFLLGGLLTISLIILRRAVSRTAKSGALKAGGPVPYGVPIAIGAIGSLLFTG